MTVRKSVATRSGERRPTSQNGFIAIVAFALLANASVSSLGGSFGGTSSIVELTCQGPGEFRGSATGFFVNTAGSFVTARHVLDSMEGLKASDGCVLVAIASQHGWSRAAKPLHVVDCAESAQQDLAVCRADPNPFDSLDFTVSPAYLHAASQEHGASVVAVGFPGDAMFREPALLSATVALYDTMQFECKPSGGRWEVLTGPSVWLRSSELSAAGTEGMSGGPVFLARSRDGQDDLFAMFACFGAQHIIAIPADSIAKFLREQHVPVARRSEPFIRLP